ncbi:MAG TPA: hypothetical protein VLA88_00420 [Candidatus Saccharimonadales bacterium]|nr:hypothetical protein [Candidatus Saccharimonadales bacterium]
MLIPIALVIATGLFGYTAINQRPAAAASCDKNNDIVYCGYTSPTDLANKVAASNELKTIYEHDFAPGYSMGDLSNWKAKAQKATVYKDGRVVLADGTVVATGANSLGREKFNDGRKAISIGGHTYYYGTTQNNFAADSIPAYVLLGDDHSLKFAALTECGNPVWGNSPAYKCDMLNQKKISDTEYEYTANVTSKNATLTKLVYDFGDGKTQTVTSNFGQALKHTYAPGKYTAKVTAYFTVNGKEQSDTRAECTKPVEVPQPPKSNIQCVSLTATLIEGNKYNFTITGEADNATLQSGSIDFGDQQTASELKPASATTVVTPHEYAKAGTYKASAKLVYDKGTTTEACVAEVAIAQPPVTPPTTPQVLPETGPIEIIGSVLGLGSAAGATAYYRSSRRNLIAEMLKKR